MMGAECVMMAVVRLVSITTWASRRWRLGAGPCCVMGGAGSEAAAAGSVPTGADWVDMEPDCAVTGADVEAG